jgi:hypothetical protein
VSAAPAPSYCQDYSQPPTQADESGTLIQRTATTGQLWTVRQFYGSEGRTRSVPMLEMASTRATSCLLTQRAQHMNRSHFHDARATIAIP